MVCGQLSQCIKSGSGRTESEPPRDLHDAATADDPRRLSQTRRLILATNEKLRKSALVSTGKRRTPDDLAQPCFPVHALPANPPPLPARG